MMAPRAEDDWHPLCTAPTTTGRLGPTPTCAAPLRPATSCKKKKKLGASAARRAHVVPRPQRQRGAPPQSSALATNGSDRGGPEHEGAAGVWVPPLPLPPDGTTAVPAPPPRLPPAGTTAAPSHRLPKAATLPPHLDTLKPNGHAARHSRGAHTSSGGGGRGVAGEAALARVGRRGTRCPRQALVRSSTPAGLQAGTSRGGELVDAAARDRLAQRGKALTR